jgi:hypothetical protein
MSILKKINDLVAKAEIYANEESSELSDVRFYLENDRFEALIQAEDLKFPFQYSEEDKFYFFNEKASFIEYVLEKLNSKGLVNSSEYYESSNWESSEC